MTRGPATAATPRRGWRLATRITAVVLGSLVPLILVLGLSYSQAERDRRSAEIDSAGLVAETVAAVVDGFSRDIEGTTLAAALAIGGQPAPISQANTGQYLEAIAQEYPDLRAVFVADLTGRVVAAQRSEGVGTSLAGRPYIVALEQGAEKVWSDGLIGSQTREITVAFARVIRNPAGAPVGYLVTAYYPPQLTNRIAITQPPDADIAFYDRKGLLLQSTARPDLPIEQRDASSSRSLGTVLTTGRPVRLDGPTTLYGEPRYGALVPVPRIGWVVAFSRPLEPLEVRLRQHFLQQMTGVTLVVLVVASILALLTRRLIRPVAALAQTASAIARGERPRVPRFDSDPDISQLAAGMAAMGDAVAEREDALRAQSIRQAALVDASRAFAEAGLDAVSILGAAARVVAGAVGDGCLVTLASDDGRSEEVVAVEQVRGGAARPPAAMDLPALLDQDRAREAGLHELTSVPMRVRDRSFGRVVVWRDVPGRPYGAEELQLVEDVAGRAGLALDNARLFGRQEEARRGADRAIERARRLQEITGQLSRSLEADEVLRSIARSAAELIGAPVGAVFLLDGPESDFDLAAAHGLPDPRSDRLQLPRHASLAGRAIDQGRTLVADDVRSTPGTALPQLLTGQSVGSEMAAPIATADQRLGVVKVFSPTVRRFSADDVALLTALAAAAAVALNNARLYREVREAVEARDEFLSIAAHELKTPVTSLKGISQLVARAQERGQMQGDRLVRLMGMVTDSSNRLATLMDDLLDVSRIQSGQLALRTTTLDLAALVDQVAAARTETLGAEHRLETELPESCQMEGDPDRLRQVVENLVDNAVKYSPEGGRISLSLVAADGRAELSVVDQGIGLPPEAEEGIFEPFGRAANATRRALPGMGLGLYICRNIVERHSGRIWAESAGEGQGTTVRVQLPRPP